MIELLAQKRAVSKREKNLLRKEGKIPATVYSHGKAESIAIDSYEYTMFRRKHPETTMLSLKLDDGQKQVLIKDVQPHPVTDHILHIDFLEVHKGEELHASVPLHFEGNSVGVREGGIFERQLLELDISCLPKDLPEFIAVDVSELELNSSLHVSDVQVSDKIKILTDKDHVIAVISTPSAEEGPETDEEEALPEIEESEE